MEVFKTLSILLIFSCSLSAKPAKTLAKTENYQDIIEKAYNLSLQKERLQAILILNSALNREAKRSLKAEKELLKSLNQVSNLFYSDKTQQLYELGVSLRISDVALASQKMTEAAKLEPDNELIQLAQLRLQMVTDCGGAVTSAKKLLETNPYSEDVRLTVAQASVCAGQFDGYQSIKDDGADSRGPRARHWATSEMELLYKNSQFQKGIELSKMWQKVEPEFPEPFYWQWKILQQAKLETGDLPEVPATKYLNICKALSARSLRDYLAEPLLCRRTAEVETFLKKNNNSNL